jgi:succinoglycan biosynthesis protein ExoW
MIRAAVVIPYFQRQPGILRRALQSVLAQALPAEVSLHVVVVDDQSPVPASGEVEGLAFQPPFSLAIVTQPNGGVSAARNAGLQALDATTDYVALLDSDDSWHPGHLAQAITALEQGRDFYFCDNARPGHHLSQFAQGKTPVPPGDGPVIEIPQAAMFTWILKDFPGQASTTLYRRAIAPDLRFDTTLRTSGEDMLFYLHVCHAASRVCFSPLAMVECGTGVNIYFENFGWDAPGHFLQTQGRLRSHCLIRDQIVMERADTRYNNGVIALLRRKIAFLVLRNMARNRGRMPNDVRRLIVEDRKARLWLPLATLQVVAGRATGRYKPT